jgi:hypothetical protein
MVAKNCLLTPVVFFNYIALQSYNRFHSELFTSFELIQSYGEHLAHLCFELKNEYIYTTQFVRDP